MTRFKLIFNLVVIGLCTVVFAAAALSTRAMVNRYVSPGGNDNGGLNVCTNAGSPCATIQHAVDMAVAGDLILLDSGTFNESGIRIDKELNIRGSGRNATIIDAGSNDKHFDIAAGTPHVGLRAMTLTNGQAQNGFGGAVEVNANVDELVILNVKFANNSANFGGAIYVDDDTDLDIDRGYFGNNEAAFLGGAISCGSCGQISIERSYFFGNTAVSSFGGALDISGEQTANIVRSTFKNNSATRGGAIYSMGAAMSVKESSLVDNQATSAGGGGIFSHGDVEINRSLFEDNNSVSSGGAVYIDGSSELISINSTYHGNSAGTGGAMRLDGVTAAAIANNTFYANNANSGAAIEADTTAAIELNNSIITAGSGSTCDLSALATVTGFHNLIDGITCGVGAPFRLGVVSNLDPVLANNGGPTKTHRLFLGSNAIDDGNANCPNPKNGNPLSLDQRGVGYGRPQDGDGDGTLVCDIGAFELQWAPVPLPIPFVQGIEDVIVAGGIAHFEVTLTNNEAEAIDDALFELRLLGLVESADAQIDAANSDGVQPLELQLEDNKITWLGTLQPGGKLTIEVETTARSLCNNENIEGIQLNGRVGRLGSDVQQSNSDTVQVECDAPINPNDIELTKTVFVAGANGTEEPTDNAELIGGQQAHVQLQLTNNSGERINALLTDHLMPEAGQNCAPQPTGMNITYDSNVPKRRLPHGFFGQETFTYFGAMGLEIDPGATWTIDLQVPIENSSLECVLSGITEAYVAKATPKPGSCDADNNPQCQYPGWIPTQTAVDWLLSELPVAESEPVQIAVINPDLGDAPDSSNHFGVNMTAYPAVQANFPTVFDAATGLPPGPRHQQARPLHLGPLVSRERDADLNPNRNLRPPTNTSNMDTFDDGVNLAQVNFTACQTTSFPVDITIAQRAVDYFAENDGKAYLNVWVDGNRDGDWADAINCGNNPAVEHIVINQEVDVVALGVGMHQITAVSDLVPWANNQVAWLRVSLSDTPAPTPLSSGAVSYGDGRGLNSGFLFGETEDYRWIGQGAGPDDLDGADLGVQLDASGHVDDESIQVALKAEYGNSGDTTSENTHLVLLPDPALRDGEVELVVNGQPAIAPGAINETCQGNSCQIYVDLGAVPPGFFGTVVFVFNATCEEGSSDPICSADALENSVSISGEDGQRTTAPANDSADFELGSGIQPFIMWPQSGVISSNTFTLRGIGRAGASLAIFTDGFESGNVSVMADGKWQKSITVPDGTHEILVKEQGADNIVSPALALQVDSELVWNPNAFSVEISGVDAGSFTNFPYGSNGRIDAADWQLGVILPPLTATVKVAVDCPQETMVALAFESSQADTIVFDNDGDGTFSAPIPASDDTIDQDVSLNIQCGNITQSFGGSTILDPQPSTVKDAATGMPIVGAKATILQGYVVTPDLKKWMLWPGDEYGRPNPQFSNSSGNFNIGMPPYQTYGMKISKPGYQPYRSGPFQLFGIFPSRSFALTPNASGNAQQNINMLAEGFNPPMVTIQEGDTVSWQNLDLGDHGTAQSGILRSGESFSQTFDAAGTYTVLDQSDPTNTATIVVTESGGPDGFNIFMPIITKQ